MTFTDEQKKELGGKLDPVNVKKNEKGFDYVEGWYAIDEANRIFGFDGWTRETIELIENTLPTKNKNNNNVVSFRARVRITAGGIVREGVGFGSGISADIHSAYEGATKEAETDAMKRALMTFGNKFGLTLYDKKKTNVGVDQEPLSDEEFLALKHAAETAKTMADLKKATDNFNAVIKQKSALEEQKADFTKTKDERKAQLTLPEAAE